MLPTLALVKLGKTVDYVVGFADLGSSDDFPTAALAARWPHPPPPPPPPPPFPPRARVLRACCAPPAHTARGRCAAGRSLGTALAGRVCSGGHPLWKSATYITARAA